jgi:hypothetical protein
MTSQDDVFDMVEEMQGIQMRKNKGLRKADVQVEETRGHRQRPTPVVKVI